MANLPTYIGKGTFASGISAISPGIPTGITNEDFLLLFVESANEAITTPTGWTEVTNSPQSTGTAAAAGGVRLAVFYKGVGGVETAPSIADTGNHQTAIIAAFRGVNLQSPFNITAGSVGAASTSMVFPTVTTTTANTLIVLAAGMDTDAASTTTMGAVTNANLTGITEIHDETIASGVGGGLAIAYGNKLTAGATGTSTATGSTAVTHAYLTMALQASEPVVRTVGQYKPDRRTVIPVGGATSGDGVSNKIYLQSEYDSGIRTTATTPKLEVRPVGTAFTNVATTSTRALTQLSLETTMSRRGSTMVYDSINKRYLSFGGYDGTTRYNDVWEKYVDAPAQPWRKLTVTGTPPSGRNLHGSTVVTGNLTSGGATRSYMIVWGGADPNDKNDMFSLRIDTPGSEAWTTITQTSAPSIRSYMSGHLVSTPGTDSSNNYIYLFGGWAAARENVLVRCTFDVDTPTAVTWTTLLANGAGGSPSARSGTTMAYKASTSKIYLYGGYNGTTMLSDFWEYDIAGNSWTNTSPTGTAPTGSEAGAGGYDPVNNRFWFTGGWTTNGTFSTALNQIGYISNVGGSEAYNIVRTNTVIDGEQSYAGNVFAGYVMDLDLRHLHLRGMATVDSNERYDYIIDLDGTETSNFPVYGSTEGEYFNARDAMASIVDPVSGEWLNIGGFDDMSDDATIVTGVHSGDVWSYNATNNTWRYANKGFKTLPPLEGRIGDYDTTRNRVILFGGLSGATEVGNEVWELIRDDLGNYVANPLFPTGTRPSPRWLGACVYDPARDRFIITMGGNGSSVFNDTWALTFSSGDKHGVWSQLTPTGSVTAAAGVGFANKASNNRLYVFGGATNAALSTVVGNFYYLDYTTASCAWTTMTQSGQTNRRTPAMAYDATNDRIVVFGGYNGSNVINTTSYYNLASGTAWANAAPATMPDARRSTIGTFINNKLYITGGRPNTGTWYRNTWELTPNYTTPNSSTWVNKYPATFSPSFHDITGLAATTNYHWQAWTSEGAVDSLKVSFGSNLESAVDFHTGNPSAPTVTTSAATSLSYASVTGNGNVTDNGGALLTERGFVWKLNSVAGDPTTSDSKLVVSGQTGAFSGSLTGLTHSTTYKYRAYATNSSGTSYGATTTFSTTTGPPAVETDQAAFGWTNITASATVSSDRGATITERGFVLNTSPAPTTANTKITVAGTTGSYTARSGTLTANTTYYIRAFATNSVGTSYGTEFTVRTSSVNLPPLVGLISPANGATASATPTFEITGQDPDADIITYGIDIDTVDTFNSGLTSIATQTAFDQAFIIRTATTIKIGQAIQAASTTAVRRVRFRFSKEGFPTGGLRVSIFATTGTYGSTATGTGSPLATSRTYYDLADLPSGSANGQWYDFWFDGEFSMTSGVTYAVVAEIFGSIFDSASDYIVIFGNANGVHAGNALNMAAAGTWNAVSTADITFEINGGTRHFYRQSNLDPGFIDTIDSADTDPFTNGNKISYTAQNSSAAQYYFNGSDGTNNHNSAWTNPANLYNGNLTDYTSRNSATAGSNAANFLHVQGTNAPSSGGSIDLVRVRAYMHAAGGPSLPTIEVYTDGLAQTLETISLPTWSGIGFTPYYSLDIPTGGWTWAKVQDLEVKLWLAAATAYDTRLYRIDVEVVSSSPATLTNGQTYYWRAIAYDSFGSVKFGEYSPTRSFTVIPSYTKTHTTNALKRKATTASHTTDAVIRDTKHYTREANASLPTVATPRSTAYYVADYTTVSTDNSTYLDQTGTGYLLFYFERYNTNSTDQINVSWNGKTTLAPSTSTVYLQIWNKTSSLWETVQSNNAAAANTDFTLSGSVTSSLSDYYDTGNKVVFRVYQAVA